MIMRRCIDPVDLSAWVDGETTLRRSRAIQQHVEDCPRCAAQAAALQRVRQTVRLLAEAEFADGPESAGIRRVGQRPASRQGYGESQRLLKRLRAELTKEQARAIWGRKGRYSGRYDAFPRVRMRWSWGWQGTVLALLLTTGVISVVRLPGLFTTSSSPARSALTNGAPDFRVTSTVARLYPDEGESNTGDSGADETAVMTGEAVQVAAPLDTSTSAVGLDDPRGSHRQSYAPGGVRLVTGSDRQPETPGLILWNDQTAGDKYAAGAVVAIGMLPERSAAVRSSEAVHDAPDSGGGGSLGVGVTLASTAMAGVAATATAGTGAAPAADMTARTPAGDTTGSLESASTARAVGKRDGGRAAAGGRSAVATTGVVVKPAAVVASAAGNAQTADKTANERERPDGDDQSGTEYQREHERFAATVWSDSADYSEEALIRRVLLAATAP